MDKREILGYANAGRKKYCKEWMFIKEVTISAYKPVLLSTLLYGTEAGKKNEDQIAKQKRKETRK